ncbi:saccharopine dehydrogenase [Thecamonas trahens ATCC 50062]|uniref:Saccharopine dehydrogenase [NAD(+), L-lysine-forming] n=1 Tax=Thecamonas trahens ATCC 50062 TaxID=461836 RepID=A0A0L0DQ71_THETB|nr:saccharopine dehydrogenase [Thecamonas trahens ATCC 50062]KNC54166.1 saccharopine dehydrogenase [Thecamonas trahens ATCC 50062]|eukprot:XP_013753984.1 saccharopine dehydrogenase [Thecamonas trahens ATCC 50062]
MWLRAETKPQETRTPVTPAGVKELIAAGNDIVVESAGHHTRRGTPTAPPSLSPVPGAKLVPAGSWPEAPKETIILGLKELPEPASEALVPLKHQHIMFAHVYKNQTGDKELLERFEAGGGSIFDLEFLHAPGTTDRIAAFGHMTGYSAAVLATHVYAQQRIDPHAPLGTIEPYTSESEAKEFLVDLLAKAGVDMPSAHVIGAHGRCGTGATRFFNELAEMMGKDKPDLVGWDSAETAAGGPFPEAFTRDIFLNAVYLPVGVTIPPFITQDMVPSVASSVIVDISCDYTVADNPMPIYHASTSFLEPTLRLREPPAPLDLIAIDHLPAMLPREASAHYAADLLPYLLALGNPDSPLHSTWTAAKDLYYANVERVLGRRSVSAPPS